MDRIKRRLFPLLSIAVCAVLVLSAAVIAQFIPASKQSRDAEPEDMYDWAFFLINGEHLLPEGYTPELGNVTGDFYLDVRCAVYAVEMLEAALRDGIELRVVSAYRSWERQNENFDKYVRRLMREKNYSQERAVAVTATQIARPGASEHNAGLALDIISMDWFIHNDDYTRDFDQTPEFAWLSGNSWRFGFILRYPDGKEDITGFIYEPWHYRFVGHDKAEQIYYSGLTLEEFMQEYE